MKKNLVCCFDFLAPVPGAVFYPGIQGRTADGGYAQGDHQVHCVAVQGVDPGTEPVDPPIRLLVLVDQQGYQQGHCQL